MIQFLIGYRMGLILGLRPANERRRYFVTTSFIGWMQAWDQPWWYKWHTQQSDNKNIIVCKQ